MEDGQSENGAPARCPVARKAGRGHTTKARVRVRLGGGADGNAKMKDLLGGKGANWPRWPASCWKSLIHDFHGRVHAFLCPRPAAPCGAAPRSTGARSKVVQAPATRPTTWQRRSGARASMPGTTATQPRFRETVRVIALTGVLRRVRLLPALADVRRRGAHSAERRRRSTVRRDPREESRCAAQLETPPPTTGEWLRVYARQRAVSASSSPRIRTHNCGAPSAPCSAPGTTTAPSPIES